jgi:hypothetical protein
MAYFRDSPRQTSARDYFERMSMGMFAANRALDQGAILRNADTELRHIDSRDFEQWSVLFVTRVSRYDTRRYFVRKDEDSSREISSALRWCPSKLDKAFKDNFVRPKKSKKVLQWLTKQSYNDSKQRCTGRDCPTFRDFEKLPEQTLENFRSLLWKCDKRDDPTENAFSAFSLLALFTKDKKMYIPDGGLSHNDGMDLIESLIYLLSRALEDRDRRLMKENPEIIRVLRQMKIMATFGEHIACFRSVQQAWDHDSNSRVVYTYHTLLLLNRVLDAFHRLTTQRGAIYPCYVRDDEYPKAPRREKLLARVTYEEHNSPFMSLDRYAPTLAQALERILQESKDKWGSVVNPDPSLIDDSLLETSQKSRAKDKKKQGKKKKPKRQGNNAADDDDDDNDDGVEPYRTAMFDFVGDFMHASAIIEKAKANPVVMRNGKANQVCFRSCGARFTGCTGLPKKRCRFFHFPNDGSALDDSVDVELFTKWLQRDAVKKCIKPTELGKKLLNLE